MHILKILFSIALIIQTMFFPDSADHIELDIIIVEHKEYLLDVLPMEKYFEVFPNVTQKTDMINPDKSRAYYATYEIKNNSLFLNDLSLYSIYYSDIDTKDTSKSLMKLIFPERDKVICDWWSGLIVIDEEKGLINGIKQDSDESYFVSIIEIQKGIVTIHKKIPRSFLSMFERKQFELFQETKEYKDLKGEMIKKEVSEDKIDALIRRNIFKYSKKILFK